MENENMKLSNFDYYLPKELIAQYPRRTRDSSRLLVINRGDRSICHKKIGDLVNYLGEADTIVFNDTKVISARLFGRKPGSLTRIEIFLLKEIEQDIYQVLIRPSRKLKPGDEIVFDEGRLLGRMISPAPQITSSVSKEIPPQHSQARAIKFTYTGNFFDILDEIGQTPLPPYIKRPAEQIDRERYQTVYARAKGAVAAPTAGLHFTEKLLDQLSLKKVKVVYLTLHIGYGTFKPLRHQDITHHHMDPEYFELPKRTVRTLNVAKREGKKILAVGTSTARVLETCNQGGELVERRGWTDLFMYSPYKFKVVNALLTNFHLPKTTLLMLVSSFADRKFILEAYQQAIQERYGFYSYGDAMLII